MFFTGMPMERATWLEKAVARMATPALEYLKKRAKRARSTAERPKLQRYTWLVGSPMMFTSVGGKSGGS